jgi:two-component system, sensor histidine kinase and response regulator
MNPAEPSPAEIMVVDDTPANLELLEEILRDAGYRVRPFSRGRAALEAATQKPPDLVMLDVNMPDMNGYETCERFKADPWLSTIPVIFISAFSEVLDKVKAFKCGAVDYVTKPFHGAEVLARLETHLKLHRLQRELEAHNAHLEELIHQRTRELGDAKGRLSILDKAKSDFLMLISHELRTPLTGLFGVTDLIFMECGSDPVVARYRAPFEESRQRLLKILEDALLLSQIEVEGSKYAPQTIPLDLVLMDAIARAGEFVKTREVNIDAPPQVSCSVRGKEELLARALQSLIETAAKFCPSGATIRISERVGPTDVALEIAADGGRIPPKVLTRFFEVFSIGESITPWGDLGLGPPVAERILSLFGGSVVAENVDPPGIRLRVKLKLATPPVPIAG